MFGTHTHIDERKTAEARIARLAQLEATLDASPDLMFALDLNGRFHDYRARSVDLLLRPPDQFQGQTVFDMLPLEVASISMAALAEEKIGPTPFSARQPRGAPRAARTLAARRSRENGFSSRCTPSSITP
jgi:PAS domain-containing protein